MDHGDDVRDLNDLLKEVCGDDGPKNLLFIDGVLFEGIEHARIGPFHLIPVEKHNEVSFQEWSTFCNSLSEVVTRLNHKHLGLESSVSYCCCAISQREGDESWTNAHNALLSALMLMGLNMIEPMGLLEHPSRNLSSFSTSPGVRSVLVIEKESISIIEELYHVVLGADSWRKALLFSFRNSFYGNVQSRFIELFTVLEGLVKGHNRITYRLSKTVAVLIGKDKEESSDYSTRVKELYDLRSKYVHGEIPEITVDNYRELYHIVRRVLITILFSDVGKESFYRIVATAELGGNPLHIREYKVFERGVGRKL